MDKRVRSGQLFNKLDLLIGGENLLFDFSKRLKDGLIASLF